MHDHSDGLATGTDDTANRFALQQDWVSVKGKTVEARHDEFPTRGGLVEDVTADGELLWFAADGATTRHMIDKSEGFEIWASAQAPSDGALPGRGPAVMCTWAQARSGSHGAEAPANTAAASRTMDHQ